MASKDTSTDIQAHGVSSTIENDKLVSVPTGTSTGVGIVEYIDKDGNVTSANKDGLEFADSSDWDANETRVMKDAEDLVTNVIHCEDDPTINPWTFRMFFLGIGLAIFGSVLQEIFYFKPQVVVVSNIFLTVIAYVLGEAMALLIPRRGAVGRLLNPGPFNIKEHAAITMCATAGAVSALATEALAAQSLYYGGYPNKGAGVFIVLSSQTFGYGIAGLLREVLVYPTKMLWPVSLPITSLLENLHRDKRETRSKMKLFYIVFAVIFVWEVVPEYLFPLLAGISIFCLAKQDSLVFTNLFGGSSGNEGMGFLSLCLDWNYIASTGSPIWVPLQTLVNSCIGYLIGIALFIGLYYSNTWHSQDFPFMSQLLFTDASNSTNYVQFDQTTVLNSDFEIDYTALQQQGIPNMTATYIGYLITTNIGFTATFVHMLLWNWDEMKGAWAFINMQNIRKLTHLDTYRFWDNTLNERRRAEQATSKDCDPHYRLILRNYADAPSWWYGLILVASIVVGLVCLYVLDSTLPWWGFFIGLGLSTFMILFFGAQMAITGFQFNQQPVSQMLAGYMFPGRPLANMYFTTFGFNAVQQGQYLLKDLKLAQYVHLSPKCAFTVQVLGCVVGALFNYIMMLDIVENQRDILLSVEGTNIWSGQNIQQFNTLAIAWSIASDIFSIGGKCKSNAIFSSCFLTDRDRRVGDDFVSHRILGTIAILHWAQDVSKIGHLQLYQHASDLLVYGIPVCRRELWLDNVLPSWLRMSVCAQEVLSGSVRQVQLPHVCSARWWNPSSRLCPHLCRIWRKWQGRPVPILGRKQRWRERRWQEFGLLCV